MVNLHSLDKIAYIVHDISNDSHIEGGKYPNAGKTPGNDEYIANHVRMLAAARKAKLHIFYTGHFLRPDFRDVVLFGNSAGYGALVDGTWGADPIEALAPQPEDWIIRKGGGMSAFSGTPFEKWLHRLGVTQLITAGGATQAGVESTVRAARDLDFYNIVVSDACRGGDSGHHEASLFNMATFAQVATVDEVSAALEAAAK